MHSRLCTGLGETTLRSRPVKHLKWWRSALEPSLSTALIPRQRHPQQGCCQSQRESKVQCHAAAWARQVHLSLLFARKGQKLPLRAPWALLLLRLLLLLLMLLLLLSVRCGLAVSSRANVAGLGVRGAGASHV